MCGRFFFVLFFVRLNETYINNITVFFVFFPIFVFFLSPLVVAIKVMKSWYLLLCCDGAVTIVVVVPFHEVRLSVNSMIACNIIILTISIITCANHISTNTYYILLSVIYSHLLTTIVAQCIPVPINVHYQSRYPYTW